MQDLNDKVTGGTLTANEWNEVPGEIQNVIEALGITLSNSDLNQLGKAISGYVANGNFYTDSGIADAYVLAVVGSKQTPAEYTVGFEIRFIAGNTNTGASTINVASLGVKNIKLKTGSDVPAGSIESGDLVRAFFDGADFIIEVVAEVAGKNIIVDGRFDYWFNSINQTLSGYFSNTMWSNQNAGSTKVHTREILVAGVDIPEVPTAKYFTRTVVSSVPGAGSLVVNVTKLENVRLLTGKMVTVSLYAKADSAKNIAISMDQLFGTGGSPSSPTIGIGQKVLLSTDWERYDFQITVSSIAGKTIGDNEDDSLDVNIWLEAGSNFDISTDSLGQQSGTFDIACVQLEEGGVVTKFEEEGQQESLSRVNRYYQRSYSLCDENGAITTNGTISQRHETSTGLTDQSGYQFEYNGMRKIPVVTILSPLTGAEGKIDQGGVDQSASAANVGSNRCSVVLTVPPTLNQRLLAHFTADARL